LIARRISNSALPSCEIVFDYDGKLKSITDIEAEMAAPTFWDNQETAQETVGRLKSVKAVVTPMAELQVRICSR
jgi:hypothetical protein